MGATYFAAAAATAAVMMAAAPAGAQLNNEPWSYRSGGGSGISSAYRQAYMDYKITGSRPRNLLRGDDGSLLTVERRDRQAVVTTRPSNYVFYRGGNVGGGVAGAGFGFGFGSAVDGWTGGNVAMVPPGAGNSPIDSWIAQVDGVRAGQ
ncbi:MAG: hypothetical protein ACM3Q1_04455 [Bacteroidales bacterium]